MFINFFRATKEITGVDIPTEIKPPRLGDPPSLVADPSKIEKEFGWKPKFSDMDTILKSSWEWHRKQANGT